MPIKRVFIDWGKPFLPQVAKLLVESSLPKAVESRLLDFSRHSLVFPGRRALRNFEEQLLAACEQHQVGLLPGRHFTLGTYLDSLLPTGKPLAGELESLLSMEAVLRGFGVGELKAVFPFLPEANNARGWWELARVVLDLQRELAAERSGFAELKTKATALSSNQSEARYTVLEQIHQRFCENLAQDGRHIREELLTGLSSAEIASRIAGPVLLIGVSDINQLAKELLRQVAEHTTVDTYVFAADQVQSGFDDLGCINSEFWLKQQINLDNRAGVLTASDQGAQAKIVLNSLSKLAAEQSASSAQVTLATADESFIPYLREALLAAEIPAHFATGAALTQSPPLKLFSALLRFLRTNAFNDMAALLRLPDFARFVGTTLGLPSGTALESALDEFQAAFLPGTVGDLSRHPDKKAEIPRQVLTLLEELTAGFVAEKRPLNQWLQASFDLLGRVYADRKLNRADPADKTLLEALQFLQQQGEQIFKLGTQQEVSGTEALELLLLLASTAQESPAPDTGSLEVIGWLELMLDDAPYAIVSGMNEGVVPAVLSADPFLPDSLRRKLGLLDNEKRLSRDCYALSAILHSRQKLVLIYPQKSGSGEILLPSRLFYRGPKEQLASRVLAFLEHRDEKKVDDPSPFAAGSRSSSSWILPPPPAQIFKRPEALAITSFKTYMQCPYTFYLRHILKLKRLNNDALELDALGFGSLLHDVLSAPEAVATFGGTERDKISVALGSTLDRLALLRFGREALPAVYMQVEQIRARLEAFADWQAERSADGWQVELVEFALPSHAEENSVKLALPSGGTIALSGRIDRVDRHPKSGKLAIIDYKSGESSYSKSRVLARNGTWKDLQLPLYALAKEQLARHQSSWAGELELAYLCLGKSAFEFNQISFESGELESAWQTAAEVADAILAGKFSPPSATRMDDEFSVLFPAYLQVSEEPSDSTAGVEG